PYPNLEGAAPRDEQDQTTRDLEVRDVDSEQAEQPLAGDDEAQAEEQGGQERGAQLAAALLGREVRRPRDDEREGRHRVHRDDDRHEQAEDNGKNAAPFHVLTADATGVPARPGSCGVVYQRAMSRPRAIRTCEVRRQKDGHSALRPEVIAMAIKRQQARDPEVTLGEVIDRLFSEIRSRAELPPPRPVADVFDSPD